MQEKSASKRDVIIAGLGGMGVLMIGHILSCAAIRKFKHVSWLPSYATEKRGGLCECIVIFSNEDIASPIIDQAQAVMVLDAAQLKTFESRVCPGGMLLVEKSGLQNDQPLAVSSAEREGRDYRLFSIPGMETAVSLGTIQMSNLIMLGAYVVITGAIPQQLVEEELGRRFAGKGSVLKQNQKAFKQGLELGQSMKT